MASSRASCCLPSVKKQKHDFNFTFRSMYNKTIIILSFCDIQNNRGLGKDYQPQPSASPQPQPCLFPLPCTPLHWLASEKHPGIYPNVSAVWVNIWRMHVFLYQIDKFNRHYKIAVIVSTILLELLVYPKETNSNVMGTTV